MVKNSKQTESFESHVTKATGTGKLIVSGFVGLRMDSASKLGITCSITNGSKRIYKLGIKRDEIIKTIWEANGLVSIRRNQSQISSSSFKLQLETFVG